ncbi:MAG: chromosome segregation protein SMC [Candidatus Aenigmarchaeota archaeon]|nr:chromosome segregation protein SMC [Candidatus Aenigmarchaeota archaeon]
MHMVRLERLVLQGFKSFKRKVSIPFPPGFSVITGPNGSGKSNIGDAITFVLGRSSARAMRAKKAHELIFQGSKTKPPSDFAKVTLYIDNSTSGLPLDESMISLSRKINSKGISTYRLNGKVVTRQQIVDILSQVGIQPDGHNIIQQGDVTQVVEMDSVGRRQIIDEISGITEYNDKKNKAMKEMEVIAGKLKEADILLSEKQQIMDKLKAERDAALEYQKQQEELEKVRLAQIYREYTEFQKGVEGIDARVAEKGRLAEQAENDVKELDASLEGEEKKLEELTKDVLNAADQVELARKLSQVENEIERKRERIRYNHKEIERIDTLMGRLRSIETYHYQAPGLQKILEFKGVQGKVSDLLVVPKQYQTAAEVAAGAHMGDVVVETMDDAVKCVKYLKDNRLGRFRFLPMDKMRAGALKRQLPPGSLGWMSQLVHHEPKYGGIVDFVFGSTACVKDIDETRKIADRLSVRMVTLDGDLYETSGALTGGFYKPRQKQQGYEQDVKQYMEEKKRLEAENWDLQQQLRKLAEDLDILAEKERATKRTDMERDRAKLDESLRRIRDRRKRAYEERVSIQQEIGKLNIQRAKFEAGLENIKLQWDENKEKLQDTAPFEGYLKETQQKLDQLRKECIVKMQGFGPVNMKAIKDYEVLSSEFEDFREKVDRITEEKRSIDETIQKIESKRGEVFMRSLNEVSRHFRDVYHELTRGEARLELDDQSNIESGLLIKASPPGKRLLNIDSMSGGEKTLTAFSFLFAIQRHKPSPFYILDEADAALDKLNTKRIVELLKKHAQAVQFIVISHNDHLVREADRIYGITMEEGESNVMGIELPQEN